MDEPQVWTLIGVFAAALFGMITIVSTMFVRVVRTEIQSVRQDIRTIDRDVNALMKHTFGIDRD